MTPMRMMAAALIRHTFPRHWNTTWIRPDTPSLDNKEKRMSVDGGEDDVTASRLGP